MPNPNMANREVCDLIFVDYATKKPFLNLDFANVTTTELTGESVFAYGGKGHPNVFHLLVSVVVLLLLRHRFRL